MMFTLLEQQMYEDIALYGIILICCLFSFCFYQCPVIVFSNCPIYFVEIVISHASEVISFRKMSIFQWVSPIYFRCNLQGVTSMMFSAFFGMLPLHFLKPFSIKKYFSKMNDEHSKQVGYFLSSLPTLSGHIYLHREHCKYSFCYWSSLSMFSALHCTWTIKDSSEWDFWIRIASSRFNPSTGHGFQVLWILCLGGAKWLWTHVWILAIQP